MFVGIDCLNVSLRGGDAFVRHHTLYGRKVCSGSCLQCGKGSAIRVERYILVDPSQTNPPFHRVLRPTPPQSFEYKTRSRASDERQRLLADGDNVFGLGLLRDDVNTLAACRVIDNIFPSQREYVADAKARQTGEQGCRFQYWFVAGRFGEGQQLVHRKIILLHIYRFNLI